LAQQLINAVQRGYLTAGTKMPGSRTLSDMLSLHRKTVIAAYEELDGQGWIETKPNKGAYVIDKAGSKFKERPYNALVSLAHYPTETAYQFAQSSVLDNPFEQTNCTYQFTDGTPDIRLTQIQDLSSLYSASLKRKSIHKKIANQQQGNDYFKEQLSNYLNLSRGLHISKDNLLVTRSTEMSVYIIAQLLLKPGDVVVVGELSLFTANMIFQKAGTKISTVGVDENGINVEQLRQKLKNTPIRMVYITPHHHYPTTVSLSAQRRVQLLQLANEYGFIIVEDDYDYDFQYEKGTVMPLASADVEGTVIYIGSFGKSLAPAFSAGFVVAPQNLIAEMHKYLGILDRHADIVMQQVLGEMIAEGDIHRHLKKSLKVYRERRNYCCKLLVEHFRDSISFEVPDGGLAIWLKWQQPVSLFKLAEQCKKHDLFIPKNILYQNKELAAMRLGFGHLTAGEMERSLEIMGSSLAKSSLAN
jgi:GntR family transcriptional regulator/MocR family aminotransferase